MSLRHKSSSLFTCNTYNVDEMIDIFYLEPSLRLGHGGVSGLRVEFLEL
jgi:hypothetical protein